MWPNNEKDNQEREPKRSLLSRVSGLRVFLAVVVLSGLVIGSAFGMKQFENQTQKGQLGPVPLAVGASLEMTPDWLPESVGRQIAKSFVPDKANYNDEDLTAKVRAIALKNPWISQVDWVHKQMDKDDPRVGMILVKAVYRQPVARVKMASDKVAYVDRAGYRLPDDQVPQFVTILSDRAAQTTQRCFVTKAEAPPVAQPIHYIEIQLSPELDPAMPEVGKAWNSPALLEGIRLIEHVNTHAWNNQIAVVDVRNFSGRISRTEPSLRMTAKADKGEPTDIRFGRFEDTAGDTEIPTSQKLGYVDLYAAQNGGLIAGKNKYMDLRYDALLISAN